MKIEQKMKSKYKHLSFYFLLFLLFILFILFYFYLQKKETKEHYLTFFIPYYQTNKEGLYKFYEDEDYKRLNFKKNFIYKPIQFGYIGDDQDFTSQSLISLLISKSKIQHIQKVKYSTISKMIQDISQNQIQLSLISFPYLSYYTFYKGDTSYNYQHINYILSIYKKYLYIITKRKFQISNIRNLPLQVKIGVIPDYVKPKGMIIVDDIMNFMNKKQDIDYQYVEYKNRNDLFQGFLNDEFEIMCYQGYYPDNYLYQFITRHIEQEIMILPFEIPKEDIFFQTNFQYYHSMVDLNIVASNYLPKKFDEKTWNRNKPDLKILCYDEYLVTNQRVENDIIYDVIQTYFQSIDIINEFPQMKYQPISKVGIERDTNMPVLYHNGAYKFYKEKGFITNESNPNCRYLVGEKECTPQTLKDNGLDII